MNIKHLVTLSLLAVAVSSQAEVLSNDRVFPHADWQYASSGPVSVGAIGQTWDELTLEQFTGSIQIQPVYTPQTVTMPCLMKAKEKANRTKCTGNARMTFLGTNITPDQQDYDVEATFEGQFDNSAAKIKFTGPKVGKQYVGHVTLIRREIAPGSWGWGVTSTLDATMAYAANGTDWIDVDQPVHFDLQLNAVPEPSTWAALGLGALVLLRRRRGA